MKDFLKKAAITAFAFLSVAALFIAIVAGLFWFASYKQCQVHGACIDEWPFEQDVKPDEGGE